MCSRREEGSGDYRIVPLVLQEFNLLHNDYITKPHDWQWHALLMTASVLLAGVLNYLCLCTALAAGLTLQAKRVIEGTLVTLTMLSFCGKLL